MRLRSIFVLLLLLPLAARAADSPRDTLATLNALRLDSQAVYVISSKDRIEIHQPDVTLYFTADGDPLLGLTRRHGEPAVVAVLQAHRAPGVQAGNPVPHLGEARRCLGARRALR